jgi:hypothetical protein
MVEVRVGTWNLLRSGASDRVQLVVEQELDLLCAQEVTRAAYDDLVMSGEFTWGAFSLDYRPRLLRQSLSETLGVAVLGRRLVRRRGSGILGWLPRPEKFVFAEVLMPGWSRPVTVASYHASPGDGKPECTLQVAHWLELEFGPAILGLDANSPGVDHPDPEQSVFYWQDPPFAHCEPALIGPPSARRHRLEDAFRLALADNPAQLDAIRAARPDGPLAVTYNRNPNAGGFTPSRYDSLWVSPEFAVASVDHLWDDQRRSPLGGSDHAMVVATLTRPPVRPRNPREDVVGYLARFELIPDGTDLSLATDLIADADERARLEAWIAEHPARGRARWSNTFGRPLVWDRDGGTYTAAELLKCIARDAGISSLNAKPGPHWWRDAAGRNLVDLSEHAPGHDTS